MLKRTTVTVIDTPEPTVLDLSLDRMLAVTRHQLRVMEKMQRTGEVTTGELDQILTALHVMSQLDRLTTDIDFGF